jgi:hypothetical protein
MGSYCSLSINEFEIDSSKSYINPFMALIFNENDKRVRRIHYAKYYTEAIEDNTEDVNCFEYAATSGVIRDRLELLGHSLEKSVQAYSNCLQNTISERREWGLGDHYTVDHLETLKKIGFVGWTDIIRKIIRDGISKYSLNQARDRSKDDLLTFVLDCDDEELFLGYPVTDYGLALRAILEALDETDEFVLDITSLVSSGYYHQEEKVCENTARRMQSQSLPFQKILILTEGSSDTFILSKSLKLLYPHLKEYFSFMDFASVRPDGGTSALERTVKSFAAAGLNNKILVLFDNDTAGLSAFNALKKSKLPTNIKLLVLPNLDFAKSYPTIGPQGFMDADINGRACSIELYLGKNVISENNGAFIPVRWSSLDSRQNDYQGEIIQKAQIQEKFKEILLLTESDATKLCLYEWDDIREIFKMLFAEAAKL